MTIRSVTILVTLAGILIAVPARGGESEQRFIDGLLDRQLFKLTVTYCEETLRDAKLGQRRRAELTVSLSRAHAQHALHSPPEERGAHWRNAHDVVTAYGRANPTSPYLMLLRRQAALVHLSRGKLLREESEVVARSAPLLEEARKELRSAVGDLTRLEAELEEELIRLARDERRPGEALSRHELRIVRHDVRFRLAGSLRQQAICYPRRSPERVSALQDARQRFISLAEVEEPADWNSRVSVAACERLLEDFQAAQARLARLEAVDPPTVVRDRITVEKARLALDQGQPEDALALLFRRAGHPVVAAELEFVRLRALLAAWRAELDKDRVAVWQKKAIAQVWQIEEAYGAYWMRRAESLLGKTVSASPATGDLAVLVRAAASYYHGGKLDDALAAYDRAAREAQRKKQPDQVFELAFTAASIEHERKRRAQAVKRYRKLALAHPRNARASEAHLLAIYNAAEAVRAGEAATIDEYALLLKEHLATWPTGTTARRAHLWLGRVYENRRDWVKAIDRYRAIPADDELFEQALASSARCYIRWFDAPADDAERSRRATEAADYFASLVVGKDGGLPKPLLARHRYAAIKSARFRIRYAKQGYREAEKLLKAVIARAGEAPDPWKRAAAALLVVALAGQEDVRAELIVDEVSGAGVAELFALLSDLASLHVNHRFAPRLANLQLRVCEMLAGKETELSKTERRTFERIETEALVRSGKRDEALKKYRRLAALHPKDARIQTGYARLLLAGRDKKSWREALSTWRDVEQHSRAGTDRWFEAKYSQAVSHFRLGSKRQAARIITLTRVLHPELGGAEMKKRFLDLLEKCGTDRLEAS